MQERQQCLTFIKKYLTNLRVELHAVHSQDYCALQKTIHLKNSKPLAIINRHA